MKILVTGAAGFIGTNFLKRVIETRPNWEVVAYDSCTYASNKDVVTSLGVKLLESDIRDRDRLFAASKGADAILHLAAESHNDNSLLNPGDFLSVNVIGTHVVADVALARDIRLHHVSTDEVFGDTDLDVRDEFGLQTAYNPSSPYSASKASSDFLVRAYVRSFDLNATISNCSNNWGEYQHWEKLIPNTIKSVLEDRKPGIYGNGKNIRDWLNVLDHCDGLIVAIEKLSAGETVLFGARDRVSNLDLVRQILIVMGKQEDFFEYVEDRPGHDRRYAIDPDSAFEKLNWTSRAKPLLESLDQLVVHYSQVLSS